MRPDAGLFAVQTTLVRPGRLPLSLMGAKQSLVAPPVWRPNDNQTITPSLQDFRRKEEPMSRFRGTLVTWGYYTEGGDYGGRAPPQVSKIHIIFLTVLTRSHYYCTGTISHGKLGAVNVLVHFTDIFVHSVVGVIYAVGVVLLHH